VSWGAGNSLRIERESGQEGRSLAIRGNLIETLEEWLVSVLESQRDNVDTHVEVQNSSLQKLNDFYSLDNLLSKSNNLDDLLFIGVGSSGDLEGQSVDRVDLTDPELFGVSVDWNRVD
jgi:hypothetical protein